MVSVTNNLGSGIYGTPKISSASTRGLGAGIFGAPKVTGTRAPAGDTPAGTPPPTRQDSDNIEAGDAGAAPRRINWRDSAYNSQIAALDRALREFETGSTTRGERYGQDFSTGLGRLGFIPAPQPMMAARSMSEGAEEGVTVPSAGGQFDIEGEMDRTSAAARGTRGMRDEFAGRGTLRSSDFAKGFGDFQNRLNQQLQAMETGRGRFTEDLQTELAQFQARTEEQRAAAEESARSRAIMRSLSQMGF
jgi:hypothetical protein